MYDSMSGMNKEKQIETIKDYLVDGFFLNIGKILDYRGLTKGASNYQKMKDSLFVLERSQISVDNVSFWLKGQRETIEKGFLNLLGGAFHYEKKKGEKYRKIQVFPVGPMLSSFRPKAIFHGR